MYWLPNLKQRRYAFNIVSKRRRWRLQCRCWLLWLALLKQNQSCNSEFCIRILIVNQYSPCFLNRIIRDQIINCDKYLLAVVIEPYSFQVNKSFEQCKPYFFIGSKVVNKDIVVMMLSKEHWRLILLSQFFNDHSIFSE